MERWYSVLGKIRSQGERLAWFFVYKNAAFHCHGSLAGKAG